MILEVADDVCTWAEGPIKYEAGTPNMLGVIGLGTARYWFKQNVELAVLKTEHDLSDVRCLELAAIPDVSVYGNVASLATVCFNLAGIYPHDLATFLDEQQMLVWLGVVAAVPLMARLGVSATVAASFGVYNKLDDVLKLVEAVWAARRYSVGVD